MTLSKVIGSSRAVSRKTGSTAKVIAVTTPSAPSPIRAAAKTSGFSFSEQVSTEPSAVTSSRPLIWAAIDPESRPVPWVPVLVAPGDRLLHDVAHVGQRQALARPAPC